MTSKLAGCCILVVEDEPLVLVDIVSSLEDEGASVLTAHRVVDALRKCEAPGLTAAVLDHQLSHSNSSAVCERLTELGIPFVIYSGYSKLEGACSKGELIEKPASGHTLVVAILDAVSKQPRPSVN
jgi:CheY-like chemotaxis protein